VVPAAGGQGLAVRAERHTPDEVGVATEGWVESAPTGDVPEPGGGVPAAGGQGLAGRAEGHSPDGGGVGGEGWGERGRGVGVRRGRPTAGRCSPNWRWPGSCRPG